MPTREEAAALLDSKGYKRLVGNSNLTQFYILFGKAKSGIALVNFVPYNRRFIISYINEYGKTETITNQSIREIMYIKDGQFISEGDSFKGISPIWYENARLYNSTLKPIGGKRRKTRAKRRKQL